MGANIPDNNGGGGDAAGYELSRTATGPLTGLTVTLSAESWSAMQKRMGDLEAALHKWLNDHARSNGGATVSIPVQQLYDLANRK